MSPRIVCFGSLNIDQVFTVASMVKRGETIASSGFDQFPGGKGANQSVALARASNDVCVFHAGCVGPDGRFLVDLLKQNKINTNAIHISDTAQTGRAIIQRDSDGDNAIILVHGANFDISTNHIHKTLDAFREGDWLLIQNEINHVSYVIQAAKQRKLKVLLNPAPSPEQFHSIPWELVDILVVNEGEADAVYRGLKSADLRLEDHSRQELAATILHSLPELQAIIITLGSNGVSAAFREAGAANAQLEYITKPALKDCKVMDTTGAGDTFVGYFLANLTFLQDQGVGLNTAFLEAVELAVVASGMACETEGAIPSIPHWEAVVARRMKQQQQ
ncbi:hypothetical protein HDU81_004740 [Chytriomyces hyalinus]|nr:hypothetical protein HDU81_004740 [Chytriomyces hyalinus]